MAVVKCKNGHFYNDSETASCPYCSGAGSMGKTIPLGQTDMSGAAANSSIGTTVEIDNVGGGQIGQTEELRDIKTVSDDGFGVPNTTFVSNAEYGSTQFIDEKKNSEILPVRGWLVVIDGEKCGLDFRIHTGNNYVGRSPKNDICFDFDQTISKEKCCAIAYDDRSKQFFVLLGEGTNNIYVNDKILLQPTALKDFDVLEIGKTKLVFRSLCNEQYDY